MNHQLLLLTASFIVGLNYVLSKKLSKTGYRSSVYTSTLNLVSAIISFPLFFYQFHLSRSFFVWFLIIVSVLIYGLSVVFSFKSYKITDASLIGIVHKTSVVIASFLGLIFLKEIYTLKNFVGLGLIIISSIVILYEGKKIQFNKGILFAFLMAIFSGMAGFLDKIILKDFSPYSYAFVNNILVFIFFSYKKENLIHSFDLIKKHTGLVILSSIVRIVPWMILLVVLQSTNVSQTIPAYKGLSLIAPVVLGILFLGETGRFWQKILGTIIGVTGIVLLY